jgi:hypothetical protein
MKASTWHDLDAEAIIVTTTTMQQAPDTCLLLQDAFSTLADGFTEAKVQANSATCAQMGLLSQNLNSLKCSVDLALRGYYTQSTNLLRGVYENWIAFHYLGQFPAKADLWLCVDKRPPNHSEMLKTLGPGFVEDKAAAREWYNILCRFAHTDALVVLPHLGSHNGETCAFFGAKFKPDLFSNCVYTISLFTSIMLWEVSPWMPPDSEWRERCNSVIELLLQFIEQEKK